MSFLDQKAGAVERVPGVWIARTLGSQAEPVAVLERNIPAEGRHPGAGQAADGLVLPRVVVVTVRIQDPDEPESMMPDSVHQHCGRIAGIDERRLARRFVTKEVREVPITARADLLEDHSDPRRQASVRRGIGILPQMNEFRGAPTHI
jgi:hypothetical protein